MFKGQNGITLVALVITIIILFVRFNTNKIKSI